MKENMLEKVKLEELPKAAKLFLSMFLVVITCGYLMAILNISTSMGLLRETYAPGEKITYVATTSGSTSSTSNNGPGMMGIGGPGF